MMNEFILNPSVAGDDGMTTFSAIAHKDWYNFGNEMRTPGYICISAQTRILKSSMQIDNRKGKNKLKKQNKGRIGFGGSVYAENSGAITKTTGQVSYAYHISFLESQISFGLAGTMSQMKFNSNYLDFYDNTNEPMQAVANSPTWFPDFNAGINFMTRHYHIGVSVLQVLESPLKFGNAEIDYQSTEIGFKRNWNVLGAAYLTLPSNPDWKCEPSFLLKMYDLLNFQGKYGPTSQLDLSLRMYYDNRYWVGISYRTVSDFIVMGGMKINKYYFSYAFDYGLNELSTSSYGSHEISLAVKLGDSAKKFRWMDRY
jgi:type IX secretion system PorP/SprF family membrane protein